MDGCGSHLFCVFVAVHSIDFEGDVAFILEIVCLSHLRKFKSARRRLSLVACTVGRTRIDDIVLTRKLLFLYSRFLPFFLSYKKR
jgi:hypothetical protein